MSEAEFNEIIEFLADRRGRLLFVGGDPSRFVEHYLKQDRFLSIVSPDTSAAVKIKEITKKMSKYQQINIDPRDFMDVSFEMSSFDGIVMLKPSSSMKNVKEFVKKIKRELKAGGRFYGRFRVFPDFDFFKKAAPFVEFAHKLSRKLNHLIRQKKDEVIFERKLLHEFMQKYLKILKVSYEAPLDLKFFDMPFQIGVVDRILKLKDDLPLWQSICTEIVYMVSKEKEMGKIFMKHIDMKSLRK